MSGKEEKPKPPPNPKPQPAPGDDGTVVEGRASRGASMSAKEVIRSSSPTSNMARPAQSHKNIARTRSAPSL